MIRWQPGYVYPPVWEPPHYAIGPLHALFFVALALAVGLLTYRRPAFGVGALILCAPFAEPRYFLGTSVTVSKAALIGFVIALIVHRTSLRILTEKPVRALLLAFAAILAAIVLSALHAAHGDAVVRELLKWIEYAAVFVAGVVGFAYDPDDRPVWTALIAVGFIEVAAAVFELLFGAASGVVISGHNFPRVAGTLEGPNQFAGWLNLLLPVLFARALTDRNPWLIASVGCCTLAELATLSRSGIVAAIVAGAVVLFVTRPTRRVGLGFAAVHCSRRVLRGRTRRGRQIGNRLDGRNLFGAEILVIVLACAQIDAHVVLESDVMVALNDGSLKGKKIGSSWRVTQQALDEFLKN